MNNNSQKLLDALKEGRETRIGLFKRLCEIENKIHNEKPPFGDALDAFVYIVDLSKGMRNYLADMSVLDAKTEQAIRELLSERREDGEV